MGLRGGGMTSPDLTRWTSAYQAPATIRDAAIKTAITIPAIAPPFKDGLIGANVGLKVGEVSTRTTGGDAVTGYPPARRAIAMEPDVVDEDVIISNMLAAVVFL